MEGVQVTVSDQQRIRISKLLSLDVEELSSLLKQLQDVSQAPSAINTLFQQLDERAIQSASEDSWKEQAEEAKAALATEKINYEQRLQQYETKANRFKSRLTEMQKTLESTKIEAEEAVAKKAELEAKLSSQQSGSLHTHVELEALKSRIESLEVEKRETLGALQRKVSELDQANEDYQNMSVKYQEMKKEASKFESESRESKASEMTHKLQKQAIEQELEMLRQRMEWTNSELDAKSKEFSSYRSEKAAQISQLQADLDQARIEATAASTSNANLERRLKEQQQRLEDVIEKNKDLQDQSLLQEEQFRTEMETQRRLCELWERAAKDTKGRVADLELTLDDMQRTLSIKDSEYQESISEISEEKVQLQIKLERATMQIEQLKEEQKRADEILNKAGLMDTSGASGFDIGRMGVLSPTAAAAAKLQKTGMSLTQVYTRYMELQGEHSRLKSENARLQDHMDQIVKELADGAPLIREQQLEYQRLQRHAEELSAQLEAAALEKEQLSFGARDALAQLDGVVKERDLLHKENQDLDRQVQNLLWRIKAPNAPQSLAPASTLSVQTESMTEAEKVFDDHFVLFSNVQELQQQNKQLRQIARQFTQEREAAEGAQAQAKKKEEQDVIEEAERLIESMREDIASKELQLDTYKQELDMMRRILKASNIRNVPATDNAVSATSGESAGNTDRSINSEASEYAKLLADLQKTFDAYRTETVEDNRQLKNQLQQAQADNSDYRIQLGRAKTQIEVLNERYQLMLDNSGHLTKEMEELRKRCSTLQENSTRHEIANQKLSSDLYAERDSASRLTAEINNLKTEKALWKSFESRLLEENQALVKEKGHLNGLLQTVQNMTNELERGSEQTKRRLESAVASKEQEVEALKEKLKEEVDTSTRMRDRREIETKEWQARIDALQAEYQSSREALIAAKTSLEHTNAKVEDLTKQIKSREEQLAIYQPKNTGAESSEATREEQLQAQLVQLHADLARHQAEADASREHLAQFQAISQTNEDRLAELTATFEEFKKEHDRKLEESTQTIKTLEAKLSVAEERAQTAVSNMVEMQNKADDERAVWRKDKEELEIKLRNLENIETQANAVEARFRRDLRVQAAQTKEAHENYERELVNHAKDIDALNRLKDKYNRQTIDLERYKAASESALSNLQAAELSWEGQKSVLQKTLSEVEKRCSELKEQNDKLHRHLEDVSAQALTIQQRMNTPIPSESAEDTGGEAKGSPEHQLAELRDVIRFVRREKEILECQHELNLQESRRLKQQLEQTNRSLEETRSLLTEERSKHQEVMVSKQQHEQLLEKINQLNLLRESNTTLRAENERLQRRVMRLEESGRELQRKLDPLNEQVREMKAELELSREELKQVGEDRDRWRTRTVEIMAKHDRIDPTEFQELKDTVAKYKIEEAEKEQALTALKTENDTLQARYKDVSVKFTKLSGHAQAWRKKHAEEAAKLVEVQKELETVKARIPDLEKSLAEANTKAGSQDSTRQRDLENVQRTLDAIQVVKEKLEAENKELKQNKEHIEKSFETLRAKLTLSINRNKALQTRIRETPASADTQAAIDAAVKSKEEELEKKYAGQAGASGSLTAADVDARIEEEKQKLAAELAEKHQAQIKSMEMMHKMRQQLTFQAKEKEILSLKNQLASTGVTTAASTEPKPINGSAEAPKTAPSPTAVLSPAAQPFRPQTAATPVRPPATRIVRTTPSAPTDAVPTARNLAGTSPRPSLAATNQQPQQPRPGPGPGQSRLRPPLGARVAAAATAATAGAQSAAQIAATTTPAPVKNAVVSPAATTEAAPTITATPAPASTPASDATPPPSGQPQRLLIKRRREDELPVNLNQPPGTSPSQEASTSETGNGVSSPSMGPTAVTAAPEPKSHTIIKRQRQLPVVESPPLSSPDAALSASAAETKPATVTIQRTRVISASDSTEVQPSSPPADVAVAPTESTATAETVAAGPSGKTSPHGQKRRHEMTESIQESITIVSTPGPADLEESEDVSTPEPSHENMSMDVEDVPPIKRVRPSSHVVITEIPDEGPSSSEAGEEPAAPGTPSHLTDFEEGEMEDEATEVAGDAIAEATDSGESKAAEEVDITETKATEEEEEDHHQEDSSHGAGADEVMEDELEEGLETSYGTPGATDIGTFEDVEVHTPQAHDEEEGELDLDLDEQHEHDGDAEAPESTA